VELFEIEKYIRELQRDELSFKNQSINSDEKFILKKRKNVAVSFGIAWHIILSLLDYFKLLSLVTFRKKVVSNKRIVFTAKNFCTESEGKLQDRIVKPLFTENILFINQSKEIHLTRINDQRVYNIGGVVKLISHIAFRRENRLMRLFRSYSFVNDSIIRYLKGSELYILWFYDLNSLSLIFSKYRNNVRLIEVQHGSIINYPPYIKPAPVKIADIFYVKNQPTIDYLKTHLCSNFTAEYRLIPYPKIERKFVPGLHIFYASTVEFNGLHPVFKDFLKRNTFDDLHVIIRLHPRERDKESNFISELASYNIKYEFDHSQNWLEGNTISNMIVISPWSSSLEDAFDNGFITITIDPVGRERYKQFIDNERFFYSDNLVDTIQLIKKNI